MNKNKFEKMIPEVKKIIKMAKEARINEESEETNGNGKKLKELLETIYDENNPRVKINRYLSSLDYEDLMIIQSFMLTGREISEKIEKFDKNTIKKIFEDHVERPSHQGSKNALIGYMVGKRELDKYLIEGINNFEKINS